MEVLFILMFFFSLGSNIFLFRRFAEIRMSLVTLRNSQIQSNNNSVRILDYCFDFDSKLDDIEEKISSHQNQPPQAPIKPNNWDSVRKAFQGPVRVDNERT
jgi:hypothetical protein